jgi:hypothetical protein
MKDGDVPIMIDPESIRIGYLILHERVAEAVGHAGIPTFVADTLAGTYPDLWKEVRRLPSPIYEALVISNSTEATPAMPITELKGRIDTSSHSITIATFKMRLSPEEPLRQVYGGCCFTESPSRILLTVHNKLLPLAKAAQERAKATHENRERDVPLARVTHKNGEREWWQFWK